jgi:peptidase MA superfamily protein
MTKSLVSLVLLVIAVAAGLFVAPTRPASADIEVVTNAASNRFPDGIQFSLFFSSYSPPTDVRLRFRILPDGVNATASPECTEGRVMNCQTVVGNIGETYMVPGAEVVYSWQVTDEAGGRFETEEMTVVYEDSRFEWQELTQGNITVHYYFGDQESQQAVLNAATETMDRFTALLNTTIDFPVKIWVYQTAQDMQPAVASRRGQGNDNTIQTLGEVGASDTALVSRDTEFLDIVRHEIAHVVTRAATRGHIVDVPVWVNEGMSTYSQRNLLPNEEAALSSAIDRNSVLPITSLGASARGTGSVVSLFYAQSGSIVAYMIDVLGEDKWGEFIAAMARDTPEGALQAVYGLDLIGLENAWREAVGLPPFDPAAPTPDLSQNQAPPPTPTVATSQADDEEDEPEPDTPAQTAGGDSDGGGISLIVVLLVGLSVAMVGLLAAAAFLAMQGRRTDG